MGMVMWPGTFEQIFISYFPDGDSIWNLASISLAVSEQKNFEVTLDEVQWMTLTFDIHQASCTNLVDWIYQLWYHRQQKFLKNPLFYLFPKQKHKGPGLTLS